MLRTFLFVSTALLFSAQSLAQEPATQDNVQRIYTPEEFERFAPRSAFDMVRQIPGFSLDNDNDNGNDARGFGQASGNVLINGQRISGKSNSARDALARIPAENVERIEIADGATLDIPGLSGQVANVVASASEGITGSWRWEARMREVTTPYFDGGEISASGKSGDLEWTLGFESNPGVRGAVGDERLFSGGGTLLETRNEKFNWTSVRPSVSGSLSWTEASGNRGNLNASYTIFEFELKDRSLRQNVNGGPRENRVFFRSEDEWNTEIGGDYEFGLGPGQLKLIGLYRYEHSPVKNRLVSIASDGSSASESVFKQTIDETESILRGEYSWTPKPGRDWQIAGETAFNVLESESDLFTATGFAPLGPDQITEPAAKVEEVRGDFAVTHGRSLGENLTMQTSLGIEVSEISQSGAASASQTFTIPKGFISTSYNASEKITLSTRLERKVDQLNFFDFIASADLNNDQDRDANPDLVPEKSWRLELRAERDFGDWGAGSITLIGEEFEDYVGRIPLRDDAGNITGDAIGNVDSATRFRVEVNGTWLLDPLGLKGVQIETEGFYQDFSLIDPLTNTSRRRSGGGIYRWELDMRHDIPNTDWAWGFNLNQDLEEANFTLDQIDDRRTTRPFLFAFIEHKNIFGMTGFIEVGNLLSGGDETRRSIFSPDRTGTLSEFEIRERDFGDFLTVGLSGSF